MGEYLSNAPNNETFESDEVRDTVAKIFGYPPEKLTGAVVLVVEVENPDGDGHDAVSFGGNMSTMQLPGFLRYAAAYLTEVIKKQIVANMVPDDIAGLLDLLTTGDKEAIGETLGKMLGTES